MDRVREGQVERGIRRERGIGGERDRAREG